MWNALPQNSDEKSQMGIWETPENIDSLGIFCSGQFSNKIKLNAPGIMKVIYLLSNHPL